MRTLTLLSATLVALGIPAWAAVQNRGSAVDFDREVRPLLAARCLSCHGFDAGKRQAGLRLDTFEGATAVMPNGKRGVTPGNPAESRIFARATAHTMPPPGSGKKPLTPAELSILKRWISSGAKYQTHWALVPPTTTPLPALPSSPNRERWSANPIDRFVLDRLLREKLSPSSEASRETLIRRVTLDLTGLPPTLEEVDAFLADRSPDAYEKVVDRLLASPRYGERMAWEWLDAARYADTNGYQGDRTRTMWPWRDWVIRALNANIPFDQFTVEQLAGDLLPNPAVDQRVATGFHRNHMLNGEGGRIAEESRIDYVFDRVETTSTVWLGLTLGCARCHDHKYDPFTQKDYYQLFAFFNQVTETGAVDRNGQANPVLKLPTPDQSAKIERLRAALQTAEREARGLSAADAAKAKERVDAARKAVVAAENEVTEVMVMEDRPQPRDTFVLTRGIYTRPGEKVSFGVPAALGKLPGGAQPNRLALARWLVSPENPLTARVAVNRYWQLFFGAGLVRTPEDFGVQGERPTHPELLDWLACEFRRSGWNVKAMHRLMVTSRTYRQSSAVTPALRERDPENLLLARGPRFRLSSAALRDQALAIGGLLVEKQGGASVKPYQPAGVWEEATFGKIQYEQDHGEKLYRRSLYTFWRRIVGPTLFFDSAARQTCTVRQSRTNTPLHALTLLNDVTFVEAARALGQRVLREPDTDEARIRRAFRMATGRKPTPFETRTLLGRLQRLKAQYADNPQAAEKLLAVGESPRDRNLPAAEHAAWTGLCSLLMNLDEVITRE